MDTDDRQVGRVLSRREVLALLGIAGASALVGCGPSTSGTGATSQPAASTAGTAATAASAAQATTTATALSAEAASAVALANNPSAQASAAAEVAAAETANATVVAANGTAVPACVVRPEVTQGPYYVAEDLVRSDIRSDPSTGAVKEGALLALTFNVSQVSNGVCAPLAGATVEVWHCDAAGQYSDVSDPGFTTTGQKWLRGAQVTDSNGIATFTTIYPGWYSSRAIHIHYKIHPDTNKEFTSQLFFDDALSDQVLAQAPYASKGQRDTLNKTDSIYQDLMLLTVTKTDQGYAATFPIGIDLAAVGSGDSGGGPGGPPNGPGAPGSSATRTS